jgi:hypothetical protein
MCYLIVMVTFTTFLLHGRVNGEKHNWIQTMIIEEALVVFSLYFLYLELMQIKNEGLKGYFYSFWNIVDIFPIIIVLTLYMLTAKDIIHEWDPETDAGTRNRTIYACGYSIATLFLWLKFLYFLRIFDSFGFLVRAINQVIIDMKSFMLILLLVITAFGDSFKVMNIANADGKAFIDDSVNPTISNFLRAVFYAYRVGLGDFDTDAFGTVGAIYCQILFILSTLITTIIMLNLFIAIISESFEKINGYKKTSSLRELAGLISENSFLLSQDQKSNWCQKGKYLIYVNNLE